MNKTELIQKIYESSDAVYKKEVETIVNTLLTIVEDTLVKNETVDIGGFGKLEIKERSERKGINPVTKEAMVIPASKYVKFKPSKHLKDKVNQD